MTDENLMTLRVGGQVYAGWKQVNVRACVEQIAGTFEIGLTERWPNQPNDWAIPAGEKCSIEIGGDTVITGYVDSVSVSYDAASHEIKIAGRDATGDLVDCSAPSTAFTNQTFEQIAIALCKPFGIDVFDETVNGKKVNVKAKKAGKKGTPPKKIRAIGKIGKSACQNGESVFRTLEKIARSEGVLLVSDGEGGLLLTRAGLGGDCSTVLEYGKNILRASLEHSHANLYSEITVKAQTATAGLEGVESLTMSPVAKVSRSIKTTSSKITRYRPLIIVSETQADAKRCRQRAEWEASNREAKARRVSVTVQGWREAETGDLWQINKRVRVKDPLLRIDEWWLIAAVNYRLDEGGTVVDLSLCSSNAFDALPEIPEPIGVGKIEKLTRDK